MSNSDEVYDVDRAARNGDLKLIKELHDRPPGCSTDAMWWADYWRHQQNLCKCVICVRVRMLLRILPAFSEQKKLYMLNLS